MGKPDKKYWDSLREGKPLFVTGEDHLPVEVEIEPSWWSDDDERELVLAYLDSPRTMGLISLGMGRNKVFRGKEFHTRDIYYHDEVYRWSYTDVQVVKIFDVVPPRDFIEHAKQVCVDHVWGVFELSYADDSQPVSKYSKALYQTYSKEGLAAYSSEHPLPAEKKRAILVYMNNEKFRTGTWVVDVGGWKKDESKYEWYDETFADTCRDGTFSWNKLDTVAFEKYDLDLRPEFIARALA